MPVPHTAVSRVAVVALCLVAGVLGVMGAHGADLAYLVLPTTAAALVCLGAAAKMARDNCFESRLVAVVTVLACVLAAVAAASIGLPGQEPRMAPAGVLLVGAAIVFLVAVAVEVPQRHRPDRATSPYAP